MSGFLQVLLESQKLLELPAGVDFFAGWSLMNNLLSLARVCVSSSRIPFAHLADNNLKGVCSIWSRRDRPLLASQ